jgi:hypothetical protein
MGMVPLREQLESSTSLLEFATRLGATCLEFGAPLRAATDDPRTAPITSVLEARVQRLDGTELQEAFARREPRQLLDHAGIGELLEDAIAKHPAEYLAVLRGLCAGPLRHLYLACEEVIVLDRGTPIPIAVRPLPDGFRATPHPDRTGQASAALKGTGFQLFEHSARGDIRVELDFRYRERIEELTWGGERRYPKIGALHPFVGATTLEVVLDETRSHFTTRLTEWDEQSILGGLRALKGVQIAVLPELSVPSVDALDRALAAAPGDFPPLIVAGSAHLSETTEGGAEITANEAPLYLDGVRIHGHRKIHPFQTKFMAGEDLRGECIEAITDEQKAIRILASEHTRLAVVICADLNNKDIHALLMESGVNLLLVPALTSGSGSFTGAMSPIASYCQGIVVVVNPVLAPKPASSERERETALEDPPWVAMVAVPRPAVDEQLRRFFAEHDGPPPRGSIIDPNRRLHDAHTWLGEDPPREG